MLLVAMGTREDMWFPNAADPLASDHALGQPLLAASQICTLFLTLRVRDAFDASPFPV